MVLRQMGNNLEKKIKLDLYFILYTRINYTNLNILYTRIDRIGI